MQPPTARAWVILLTIGTIMYGPTTSAALPPIRLTGELGYDFRYEKYTKGGSDLTEHRERLRLDAATFIMQPYIAQVQGGADFILRQQDREDGSTTGVLVNGDLNLRVFPFSPFPFRAFFSRSDDSQDTDLTDRDTLRTRYGIEQRYTNVRWGRFRFLYEHLDQDQQIDVPGRDRFDSIDVSDLLQFDYSKTFGRHALSWNTTANFIDRNEERDDSDRIFSSLRHSWQPSRTLSTENRLTYTDEEQRGQRVDILSQALEFNNATFWRPRTTRPLVVNGLTRIRFSETTSDTLSGISETDQRTVNMNVGASYEYTRNWRYSGNAAVTAREVRGDDDLRTVVRGRAQYTADILPLGFFDYGWAIGAEVANFTEEEGAVQQLGTDFAHYLNRTWGLGRRGSANLNLNQTVGFIEDTEGRSVQNLLHNFSMGWTQRVGARSQTARLSASDSRTFGGGGRSGNEESEFQLINFLASIDQRLSRLTRISGSFAVQATRSVIAVRNGDSGGDFQPGASINATFTRDALFLVPRLRFKSTLRLSSDSYFPGLDEPRGPNQREQLVWENRLDYSIGRLIANLTATYSESNTTDRFLLFFRVRRFFGNF